MRPGRRDPAVRRWLRRPIWWLGGVVVLAILMTGPDLFAFPHQLRAARGDAVEARVLGSWDGGVDVPVAYPSPDGGEPVTAIARTTEGSDVRVGPVSASVDPDHPTTANLAGYDPWQLLVEPLTVIVPALAAIALWGWTRVRRMRRSEALAASDVPSFRMIGVPRPGRISPRRWHLGLYPLDAPVGAAPVCTVALIDGDDDIRPRLVEVKGEPRPGGEVVVWEPGSGRIWWPAGRVLLKGGRTLPAAGPRPEQPPYSPWRWAVPVIAVVVMVVALESGENRDLLLDRSEVVVATVVDGHRSSEPAPTVVSYRTADKVGRKATVDLAGPQRTGDRYRLRVDPDHPERAWQPRTSEALPGSEGGTALLIGNLAFIAVAVGLVVARRPRPPARRTWSGLIGPPSGPPAPYRPGGGRGGGSQPLR